MTYKMHFDKTQKIPKIFTHFNFQSERHIDEVGHTPLRPPILIITRTPARLEMVRVKYGHAWLGPSLGMAREQQAEEQAEMPEQWPKVVFWPHFEALAVLWP